MDESERIRKIMEVEGMTARQFSEEVGIQPGTVSNILNGRNKPSLEVMQKVLLRFRLINSNWLVLGTGSMYAQKSDSQQTLFDDIKPQLPEAEDVQQSDNDDMAKITLRGNDIESIIKQTAGLMSKKHLPDLNSNAKTPDKKVKKVVIFFDDDTFQELGS